MLLSLHIIGMLTSKEMPCVENLQIPHCVNCRNTNIPKGVRKGGGLGLTPPLNLLCYKNVITYAKEFVYVFVHFLLV